MYNRKIIKGLLTPASLYSKIQKDEGKIMKRKIARLLVLVLSVTLLAGCKESAGEAITPKKILDSEERTIVYVTLDVFHREWSLPRFYIL